MGPRKGKYKGVSWSKQAKKYTATGYMYGKQCGLGYFDDEIEAAKNYDWHVLKMWQNCYLNFPEYDYANFVPKILIDSSN